MLSDKYKTAAEFLGPLSYATMYSQRLAPGGTESYATAYSQRLAPGGTESSKAADTLARLTGPYMQALGQSNQSGYKNKPANIGTPRPEGYNKRTARLLAQAKQQGQANNPRITAQELQGIIAKAGGGDAFLKQTSGMQGLTRDLGPVARRQFNSLVADYVDRNRKTGDGTPQAPVGTTPTVPGQPRSTLPSTETPAPTTEAPAPTTENASGETVENTTEPDDFLNNFIKMSPVFKNIGNPQVRVGGMSVGNIQMIR